MTFDIKANDSLFIFFFFVRLSYEHNSHAITRKQKIKKKNAHTTHDNKNKLKATLEIAQITYYLLVLI